MDHVRTSSFEISDLKSGEKFFDGVSDVDFSRRTVLCGV
jgi:hypothetical protein